MHLRKESMIWPRRLSPTISTTPEHDAARTQTRLRSSTMHRKKRPGQRSHDNHELLDRMGKLGREHVSVRWGHFMTVSV